jgi:hypothetical protein
MAAHSTIGASSAYRWFACPGSVQLSKVAPKQEPSIFAAEGTAAHELAEVCLKKGLNASVFIGREFNKFEVTKEMSEAVQVYLDAVRAANTKGTFLMVEHKFQLDWIDKAAFGTNDAMIAEPYGTLHVFDYKHGVGVPVDAVGNEQLLYYALGGARTGDYTTVKMTIVQPRARHKDGPIRTWEIPIAELYSWENRLRDAIAATKLETPVFKAGDHCKFCPASTICETYAKRIQDLIPAMFDDIAADPETVLPKPEHLEPENLQSILNAMPEIDDWLAKIKRYAEEQAKIGVRVLGHKLVRKKTFRKWADADDAARELESAFGEEIYSEPELLSPSQIEKKFGKAAKAAVEGLTVKPEGELTLVSEDDPRPEVNVSSLADEMFDIL